MHYRVVILYSVYNEKAASLEEKITSNLFLAKNVPLETVEEVSIEET